MALIVAGVSVVQGYVLARSGAAVSCGADTTEDILATITVPANALGISGVLRVTTSWTSTSSGNSKTIRGRFSGASGTAFLSRAFTTEAYSQATFKVANRGTAASQEGGATVFHGSGTVSSSSASVTASADTTVATTIVLTGQKASSGETLTLESYIVELLPTS